jgi:hypothetical protein
MTRAFFISLVFHAIIVVLLIVGLPHLARDPLTQIDQTQIVELVELSDETTSLANTPAKEVKPVETPPPPTPKPEPAPEPKPAPKPKPEPVAPPPPPAPEPEPVPEPEPEPVPVPEPPEPQPVPVPEPEPTPEPVPEPAPEPEPVPEPEPAPEPQPEPKKEVFKPPPPPTKPKVPKKVLEAEAKKPPPPKEQAKPKDDFDSLLNAVNDLEKKEDATPAPSQPAPSRPSNTGGRISDKLTMTEMDAVKYHFERCWAYNQVGGIDSMRVPVVVRAASDGRVLSAKAQLDARYASDPTYRAFAASAERSTMRCTPMPIPGGKFDVFADGFILNYNSNGLDGFR